MEHQRERHPFEDAVGQESFKRWGLRPLRKIFGLTDVIISVLVIIFKLASASAHKYGLVCVSVS